MSVREKIQPYIEQGLSPAEISKITGYNYKTVYCAIHPEMYKKKKTENPIERPKGWNKDRNACKKCKYRGYTPTTNQTPRNGCDFIDIVGHSRGCKVEDCNRFVKGKRVKVNTHGGLHEEELGEQST